MSTEDNALFDAASEDTLLRLLQKRGVFAGNLSKEDLRPLFGLGFSYTEWKELRDEQRSST